MPKFSGDISHDIPEIFIIPIVTGDEDRLVSALQIQITSENVVQYCTFEDPQKVIELPSDILITVRRAAGADSMCPTCNRTDWRIPS